MTVVELFPTLKRLNRADKLKVMQFLISELASEEEATLESGATYAVWLPLNAHQAAHQLATQLDIDSSDTWTDEDRLDLVQFSLQYSTTGDLEDEERSQ